MNWLAMLIALPFNLLIIWVMYSDFKGRCEENKRKQTKLDNLVMERLYINLSEEDKDMLNLLAKRNGKPAGQFIHCVLKEEIKKATHV